MGTTFQSDPGSRDRLMVRMVVDWHALAHCRIQGLDSVLLNVLLFKGILPQTHLISEVKA